MDDIIFSVLLKWFSLIIKTLDDAGDEYNILAWTKKTGENQPAENYDEVYEIFSSCAGAAMYNKAILDKIGLFDENFFAYMEDVDLSYRAKINGYKNLFCPDSVVYHGRATSLEADIINLSKIGCQKQCVDGL